MMRVLIVDDEPIARRGLRRMLEGERDVAIAGEADNGRAAIEAISLLKPDLVFLDVQMPGIGGLDVVRGETPLVVFVTAHEQYAVEAFDRAATDYVLKPIDPDRLQLAVTRARERLAAKSPKRLVSRSVGKTEFVDANEIEWLRAEDNYVRIHAGERTLLMRTTVSAIEQQLDPARFARIRSSTIVRVDRIREIHPLLNGTCRILLRDGTQLTSARRFRSQIEHLLG